MPNIHDVFGHEPGQATDSAELAAIEQRLNAAAQKLAKLVPKVGQAKQIREFNSDQRKSALARAVTAFRGECKSASDAEFKARASFAYEQEMQRLAHDLQTAESVLASRDAIKCEWESAQSLL